MIDTILHAAFYIPMAIFFRIEFRGVGRQVLHMNIRMLCQICLDQIGPMSTRAVPNENERLVNGPPDMFQSDNQFLRIDRAIKMAFVNLAADGQGHQRRSFPAIFTDPLEQWGLAFGRPGKANRFRIGQAKLIFKDDLCAEPLRFFLSGANPASARPGSALHRARWRAGPVFGHSNRGHVTVD